MALLSVQTHPPLAYPDAGAIDTTQERLERFDPQQHPEINTTLLTEARLLDKAALFLQADNCLRERAALLFNRADELHQNPSATASELQSLALSLAQMPKKLLTVAGNLGACETAQEQLNRFRAELESPATNARPAANNRLHLLRRIDEIQVSILEARRRLEDGELGHLPELTKTIRKDIRELGAVLPRAQILRPDDAPPTPKGRFALISRLGRAFSREHPAAKQLSQLAQPLRADALVPKLLAASQELSDLEAQFTHLGSDASISKRERAWVLATCNGLLRKERAALDEACTRFKDDAAGGKKAEAAIARAHAQIATVRKQLHNPQLR